MLCDDGDGCGSFQPLFIPNMQMMDLVFVIDGWLSCRICIRSNVFGCGVGSMDDMEHDGSMHMLPCLLLL